MSSSNTDALAIASRYATAIFALALKAKKEALVTEELSAIAAAIEENDALRAALASPLVSRAEKAAVLAALAEKAHKLTTQSLAAIADGGRAEVIPAIAVRLRKQLSEERGELVAEITSARPLGESMQQQISDALAAATGKDIQLTLKEDESVLGGVAIQLGSMRLDATLAGALNTMRTQLIAAAQQSS